MFYLGLPTCQQWSIADKRIQYLHQVGAGEKGLANNCMGTHVQLLPHRQPQCRIARCGQSVGDDLVSLGFVHPRARSAERVEAQAGIAKERCGCAAPLEGDRHEYQEILAGDRRFHASFGHK